MSLPRHFHRVVVALAVVVTALFASHTAWADDTDEARQLVLSVAADATHTFAGVAMSRHERFARLRTLMERYADLPLSAEDILGRYWRKAPEDQRNAFLALVVDYAMGSWSNQLTEISPDQHIDITTTERTAAGRTLVHSLAVTPGDTTPVDWTVCRTADGRLVIADVAVDGASIIQTMQGDFTAIIRANDGRMTALLDALRAKIAAYRQE